MHLKEIYLQKLGILYAAEKKYAMLDKGLCKATKIDELKQIFVSSDTPAKDRIERLGLILKSHKAKPSLVMNDVDQIMLDRSTQITRHKGKIEVETELKLIEYATVILQIKIGAYDQVLQMAKVLENDLDTSLLDQSSKELKNNYNYLLQVSGNIVYDGIK